MNVGLDLDKVLIDSPPFIPDALIERLYRKQSRNALAYRFPSKLEQYIRRLSHHYLFRPPLYKNIAVLKKHTKANEHKHYLISSRFGFLQKPTEHLMRRYNFEKIFTSMHFNFDNKQPHVFKNNILRKLSIHHYVDDDLAILEYLAEKNPSIMFYWLNKKQGKIRSNLYAIIHLSEFFDQIKKKK